MELLTFSMGYHFCDKLALLMVTLFTFYKLFRLKTVVSREPGVKLHCKNNQYSRNVFFDVNSPVDAKSLHEIIKLYKQ